MNKYKRKRLERTGFRLGTSKEFLGLTAEEQAMVELRLAIGQRIRQLREKRQWSQQQLAERMRSSQSRVAKMEVAAEGVSLDLMISGLFALGGKVNDLGSMKV